MANFHTHITYAAAGAGLLSVLCLQVGMVDQQDALFLALTGTIGGILPDVDLQRSYPSRIMFSLMGIFIAFLMIFSLENDLSIVELWMVGIGTFVLIRFPVWQLFHRYSTHRGSIHSLAVALLSALAAANLSFHLLNKDEFTAWLTAFFVFLGFILHLVLDEIYSVDFSNRRIKRSFGSALKLLDWNKPGKTALILALCLFFWFTAPDERSFIDTLISPQTYQIIMTRLLPL